MSLSYAQRYYHLLCMHQRSDCRRLQYRTNVGGRFPIDSAKKAKPQPHEKAELFFVTDTFGEYGNSSPSSLAYRLDNTLGCASGEKICIGPTAMMQVLSLWVFDAKYHFKKLQGFDFGNVKKLAAECV
jgi:hypothetical protein